MILGVVVASSRTRLDPQVLWDEAHASLRSGQVAAAKNKLGWIGWLRAPTPLDWLLGAQIAIAEGLADEALVALGHVPDDHPMASQAFLLAGRIDRQRNRMPAAESAFRKAIALDPRLIEAHRELIFLLGMQLRRREVDAEFKTLARLAPLSHHELFTWGLTHFTVWVRDSAEKLEAFIRADPNDRDSRLSLATFYLKSPDLQSRVEPTLEPLASSDPEATALRVELKLDQGLVDEAVAMLDLAPAGHPSLASIRGRLALIRGNHTAAIAHFQDALSQEPYDRAALSALGKALLLKGDKSAAQGYLDQVKRLDEVYNLLNGINRPERENQPADLIQLARACEAATLTDEARGWYLLAIGRDPLNAEAQQALRRLRATDTP